MDKTLKQAGLKSLAKIAGDVAKTAIRKESSKIVKELQGTTQYDIIFDQLELLETIAYRVSEGSVVTISDLLEKLKSMEITYVKKQGFFNEKLQEQQNNYTLIVKALEVLENIRYHQPLKILDIFFEYSCHDEESVSKYAMHGIEMFSGYDLNIFYGDGKEWSGLGCEPQEKVLEKIATFSETQNKKYFSAIIVACEQVLSPTISGSSSTYNAYTWRTGAVPAIDGVKTVRKKALDELQNLYSIANKVEQKKAVLSAIETATNTPHKGEYGDDVQAMIVENSITVVKFMKKIAVSDDMQIMQKIEHDAYWMFYHKGKFDETIHNELIEIRDALYEDNEYKKFRILIGFESIFHDWEKGEKERDDFDTERKVREAKTQKLAKTINENSYIEWKKRILSYASIKSNDMATFPYFGKFLEYFGKNSPDLAMQLLLEASDELENFIVAILIGISKAGRKDDVYSLIEHWCDEGKYLSNLARYFEYSSEVNEELFNKLLDKSLLSKDFNTLNQIISSVSAQYTEESKDLIQKFFIPALKVLTKYKNSGWISGFWFRKQRGNILSNMEVVEQEAILENLIWLHDIEYHAEEILSVLARQSPELVIKFFCDRLSKEDDEADNFRYEAVPFSFYKLSEPLSQYPVQAIDAVLEIYDDNYNMFSYRGGRLLKNIFPNFPVNFQRKLLSVIESKEEKDLLFVIAILRNYDGNRIILDVCKELVEILPDDGNLSNELTLIMQSTGVVSGEYGYVNAYKQKIKEIQPWLQGESHRVTEFAQNYIVNLEKRIEYEQKRADEDITLRKHQYGTDED